MVNATLIETILREQDDPGHSTTRQIRDLYNNRSGEEPIVPHTDQDKEFQKLLLQALDNVDETPISYTVKLKECDDNHTPTGKRRSIIKLPKETKDQSESDDQSSDAEKVSSNNNSSDTTSKPFSPLFLNNMKKFGVSSDWLAKRSNSLRQSTYSLSSVKSNTSQLDAMIKSASTKPIKSNRKLSFVEPNTASTITIENETEKENVEPAIVVEKKTTAYDLSSEEEEEEPTVKSTSPDSNEFALRIPRVNLQKNEKERLNASTSSSSSLVDDEVQEEKPVVVVVKKRQRKSKTKKPTVESPKNPSDNDEEEPKTTSITVPKKEKTEQGQARIEHLKKLLRISGIKLIIKKTELEQFNSTKKKINYLKSLFDAAGFQGNLTIKDCEKFRTKRDTEKELEEIQLKAVHVKGHVKGGRTLRGQARSSPEIETPNKRKRQASSEVEDDSSSDEEKPTTKKRRILQMQASPEISDDE